MTPTGIEPATSHIMTDALPLNHRCCLKLNVNAEGKTPDADNEGMTEMIRWSEQKACTVMVMVLAWIKYAAQRWKHLCNKMALTHLSNSIEANATANKGANLI